MATYTIQRGDTLSGIAKNNNTTVDALLAANPYITDKDVIFKGKSLEIPDLKPAASQSDSGVVEPPVNVATGVPFETPNQDLETLVASALNATYEPQRLAINQAMDNYVAQMDAANSTAKTNYENMLQALDAQQAKDTAQLREDADHQRLKSGWHNSALAQKNQAAESDLMAAYTQARTAKGSEYNTAYANNEAAKNLYIKQINDQLSQLTSQQQAEYAAKLLELQYNQQMSNRDFERQKELMAYQNSLSRTGGSNAGITLDDLYGNQFINTHGPIGLANILSPRSKGLTPKKTRAQML